MGDVASVPAHAQLASGLHGGAVSLGACPVATPGWEGDLDGGSMPARVMVIGLDGATFDVMDPLMAQGRLPHLSGLRRDGVSSALASTFPDSSAPAWTSCRTGVNPGMHGVFEFWRLEGYRWELASSLDVRAPTVEQMLSRRGFRVCMVNVPLTYPPKPLLGVVVPGLPVPLSSRAFHVAVPDSSLASLLEGWPPDALPDAGDAPRHVVLARYLSAHRQRAGIVAELLARGQWDFFMVVFTLADKIQHTFWRERLLFAEGDRRPEVTALGGAVDSCYELLDDTVGRLLSRTDESAHVMVVSDHGFGSCDHQFYPNVWLRQRGYLRLKPFHKIHARQIVWRSGKGRVPRPAVVIGPPCRRIAWERTKAFGALYVESRAIWLNMRGRQPRGTVSEGEEAEALAREIADGLQALTMPDGTPVVDRVLAPEEVFRGPHTREWGDLLIRVQDPGTRILGVFTGDELVEPVTDLRVATGQHRPEGIFLARGPRVAMPPAGGAHIMDVAPTVLDLLGVTVPPYMEGKALFAGR